MNIEQLIPNGEWKSDYEYVIRCPFCGDATSHNHLHINIENRVFYCFYCGKGGPLSTLLGKLGISGKFQVEKRIQAKEPILLDFERFTPLDHRCVPGAAAAYKYLEQRGVPREESVLYNMRLSLEESSPWYGRIIIPIYERGQVVCFVGRSFFDFVTPKYLFPHRGQTLLTSHETIFIPHWDRNRIFSNMGTYTAVIVEGMFDALSLRRVFDRQFYPIALLGKSMSEAQLYKVLNLPNTSEFCVMLDADAHWDSMKVAKLLASYGKEVHVALLKKGDPDTTDRFMLSELVATAPRFSWEMEMQVKLSLV